MMLIIFGNQLDSVLKVGRCKIGERGWSKAALYSIAMTGILALTGANIIRVS
jgi:hypothetical protein